jgi:hypothetical protein
MLHQVIGIGGRGWGETLLAKTTTICVPYPRACLIGRHGRVVVVVIIMIHPPPSPPAPAPDGQRAERVKGRQVGCLIQAEIGRCPHGALGEDPRRGRKPQERQRQAGVTAGGTVERGSVERPFRCRFHNLDIKANILC